MFRISEKSHYGNYKIYFRSGFCKIIRFLLSSPPPIPMRSMKILPHSRVEEDEQWEQLKAPGEHVEHQHIFGEHAEMTEVLGRAGELKAGTDVVDGRGDGGEIGHQVLALERDEKQGSHEDDGKGYKVHVD